MARGKWAVGTTLALQVLDKRSNRRLFVGITATPTNPDAWSVTALETDATADTEGILEDHAHEHLGSFTLDKAIAKAQAYAATWRPNKSAACACDEIQEKRRKPAPAGAKENGHARRQAQARRTRR